MAGGDPARHRAEKLLCNGKQGKVGQGKARLGKVRKGEGNSRGGAHAIPI